MRYYFEILDRMIQMAARETDPSRPPMRVLSWTLERRDHERDVWIKLDFDDEWRGRHRQSFRIWQDEIASWEREEQRLRNYTLPNVLTQEIYEAHLRVLSAENQLHRAMSASLPPATFSPDREMQTATEVSIDTAAREYVARSYEDLHRLQESALRYLTSYAADPIERRRRHEFYGGSVWEMVERAAIEPRARASELRQLMRQQWPEMVSLDYVDHGRWNKKAIAKGWKLLKSNLDPAQLAEFESVKAGKGKRFFHCVGSLGGLYRIVEGTQQNVYEFDRKTGVCLPKGICFLPEGDLVIGDVMLAQKIALELDEEQARKVAIPFTVYSTQDRIPEHRRKQLIGIVPKRITPKKPIAPDYRYRRGRRQDWWMA